MQTGKAEATWSESQRAGWCNGQAHIDALRTPLDRLRSLVRKEDRSFIYSRREILDTDADKDLLLSARLNTS